MSNKLSELGEILEEFNNQDSELDLMADDMAQALCNRLIHVKEWTLCLLKRRLQKFNMNTRLWEHEQQRISKYKTTKEIQS